MDSQQASKRSNSGEDFQNSQKRVKSSDMNSVPKYGGRDITYYSPALTDFHTISEKMILLRDLSCLKLRDLFQRYLIAFKILKTLKPYYPYCQMRVFGSSSCNGFGVKGTDLDLLFLPYPEYYRTGEEQDEDNEPPTADQVLRDEVSRGRLAMMGEKTQLWFVGRILKKKFKNAAVILAKCPILQFTANSKNSEISCDLSCRNMLVVYNTELLAFFKRIDKRVEPLVNTVRFWAVAMDFFNTSGFSGYSLTLLVIFFLQNAGPAVLPSVDYLMEKSESSCYVAGWNVSFTQNLELIPISTNQDSEGVLLYKFFLFYWNFDFTRYAVCVRTGKAVPIEDLKNSVKGFEVSIMCIQDPFKLSHNLGRNMRHYSFFSLFKPSMHIASSILTDNPDGVLSEDIFLSLFDKKEFNGRIHSKFYFRDLNNIPSFLIFLDHQLIAALGDGEGLCRKFSEKAAQAVIDVLQLGLLMKCRIIDERSFSAINRNEKIHQGKDRNCLLTIECDVYHRTWIQRKITVAPSEFVHAAAGHSSVLKTQHLISKGIINSSPHLSCPYPIFSFECKCYVPVHSQIPYLIVEPSGPMHSKDFELMHQFLKNYIPKTVSQFLLENNSLK